MKPGSIVRLALAFFLSVRICSADWEVVTRDGREYVTLKSFCDFYHFQYPANLQGDVFRVKNGQFSILLKADSREAFINGVRYWLSFGVHQSKDDWLLSRVDLVKLFEPLLRPHLIDGKKPVIGVVIDPGHGGSDNGAISARGVMEKTLTLDTALRLEKNLRAAGLKTVLTRRSDVYVDLYERAQRAASYDGYIFVSLHFNSASPEARGLETYACSPRGAGSTQAGGVVTRADYQKVPGNDTDSFNVLLASEVHRCITTLNPNDVEADRGVKRARFVVLKQNTVPAILVEGGFLSNRMEASVLATADYRQRLADAVAKGVLNFAARMAPPEKRVTPPVVRPVETPKPAPKPAPAVTASSPVISTNAPPLTTSTIPVVPAAPPVAPTDSTPATSPSAPGDVEKPRVTEPEPPTTIFKDHAASGTAPASSQTETETQP